MAPVAVEQVAPAHVSSKAAAQAASSSQATAIEKRAQEKGRTGLFGYPISLSLAPTFHQACYDHRAVPWTCSLLESQRFEDLLDFIQQPDFVGTAVTMPYKAQALKHVDHVDQEAELIGATNTIYWKDLEDGRRVLSATNTDVAGVAEAMRSVCPAASSSSSTKSRTGLIVGGGSTTRTSVYTLRYHLHCDKIYIINRLDEEVDAIVSDFKQKGVEGVAQLKTPEQARQVLQGKAPSFIINAIPSFPPQTDGEKLARETLEAVLAFPSSPASDGAEEERVFLEMCYHPHPLTEITLQAREKGWRTVAGMEAMLHQAVAQQLLWLPAPPEGSTERAAFAKELLEVGRKVVFDALRKRGVDVDAV